MSDCKEHSSRCLSDCKERSSTCLSDCKEHSFTCMSDCKEHGSTWMSYCKERSSTCLYRIVKNVAARVHRIVKNIVSRVCRIVKNVASRVYRIGKPFVPSLYRVKSVSSKPNCSVLLFAVITYRRGPSFGVWISRQALNFDAWSLIRSEIFVSERTRLQTHMSRSCSQMFYSLGVYFSWLHFFLFPKLVRACRLPFRYKYNSDIVFPFFGRL